jgi:cell division protein FtsQ
MDRSFADRPGLGRLTRPRAPNTRRRAGRPTSLRRAIHGVDWVLERLWRPLSAAGRLADVCCSFVWHHRRLRAALLCVLVSLPLLAGGWLWLRSSSLVSVEHVRVSGLHGSEAHSIETALTGAAMHMSTLDVHTGALRAAVASFPVVRSVRAIPSFPHGLRIEVVEQLPVAALTNGGTRTAVAADGVVLGPALLSSSLPTLDGAFEPSAGQRLHNATLLESLAVLGAAPAPLARHVARVYEGPQGLTIAMHNGLLTYFGDAARPHAKWISLARVLVDPSSAGASYVDVRLPERPAAGFSSSAPSSGGTAGQSTTPESTVDALAAALSPGTTGEPAATGSTTATTEASSEPEATSTPAPEAESNSGSGE